MSENNMENKEEKLITVDNVLTEQEAFTKLIEDSKKRTFYARLSGISAFILCVAIVATLVYFVPKVTQILDDAGKAVTQAQVSLENLDTLSEELIKTADNMNTVIEDNAEGLGNALVEINSIDIETLNEAIADLKDTVEPFAKFFKSFK